WGTPDMFEDGLVPQLLLGGKYGRRLHFWDLPRRRHVQEIDFGAEYQLVFELRPAHDPTKAYGFVNCVVSRDGKRIYFTNSLYGAIDPQFYPDGVKGWMVKLDAEPGGGIRFDRNFFMAWPDGYRPHQVRLQGGDASSDSYCYP